MKALFLKNGHELDDPIFYLINTYFNQIEIVSTELAKTNIIDFINQSGQISMVVINVAFQPFNLAEQLEIITDCIGEVPMIFICSPQTIKTHLNDKILNNHRTNFFVQLPLKNDLLAEAIQGALNWIKDAQFEQSIGAFTFEDLQPMRIKNFFIFNQMPYDVYVQLTTDKFGKIIQGNRPYSHHHIQSYSQKGVKYLYLKKDDALKFLTSSIKNIAKFYAIKNIEKKKLILLHQQTIFFIRECIQILSVTDDIVELTRLFIESSSEFILQETPLNEIFELVIQKRSISFAQQTLLSIYLARAILLKMQWTSDMALNKIALAAILQDIHLINDDLIKVRSVNDPYLKSFSEEEQKNFYEHPEKAAVAARLFHGFSDVDFILMEHHERPSSDGFPKGVNASSLNAISCIFILVNNIIAKLAQQPSYSPKVFREVVAQLKPSFSNGNFKEPFKYLEKIAKEING